MMSQRDPSRVGETRSIVVVAVLRLELFLVEQPNSLKGKRQILKRLKERIANKFLVSVAEVGQNDLWQKGEIGLAVVSSDQVTAERTIESIIRYVESDGTTEIVDQALELEHY